MRYTRYDYKKKGGGGFFLWILLIIILALAIGITIFNFLTPKVYYQIVLPFLSFYRHIFLYFL